MPYATALDMATRFSEVELIQLTDRDNAAEAIDQAVLLRALQDADAEIDARLQARFKLPLATVPRLLVNIACDIARYRLFDDRVTDQVARRYQDATKLLDKIGSGQLSLGLDNAAVLTQATGGPQFTTPARVFTADGLADYNG